VFLIEIFAYKVEILATDRKGIVIEVSTFHAAKHNAGNFSFHRAGSESQFDLLALQAAIYVILNC
jgi:hypothetical protein